MTRSSIVVLALGALLVTASAVAQPTPKDPGSEAPDADAARAAQLMRDAIRVGNGGDWKKARVMLEEAFALKPTFDIAANLSLSEENTGDLGLAGDHLAYAIRMFPVVGKPEHKKTLLERYEELSKKVSRLTLRSNEAGAKVFVDERPRGQTPLQDALHLDPGQHAIKVEKQGYVMQSRSSDAVAGGQASMDIQLERDPNTTVPVPTATTTGTVAPPGSTTPPPEGKPAWPAIVLGSVAAVGIGVGIGGTVAAVGKNNDAIDDFQACGRTSACEQAAQDSVDSATVLQGVGITGFAIGAASLTGMIIYLAIPGADSDHAAIQVVPLVGPTTQGLSVGGRF